MEIITTASQDWHFEGIKELQSANLPNNISEEECISQGFVTCDYDVQDLKEMNSPHPHIIIIDGDKVVGYALVLLAHARSIMPILLPMFHKIDEVMSTYEVVKGASYFVMGQICIDKSKRGRKLFYSMYEELRNNMCEHFDMVFTEVSSLNKRSLRAHSNQGFKTLCTYTAPNGHSWEIIYWDWRSL